MTTPQSEVRGPLPLSNRLPNRACYLAAPLPLQFTFPKGWEPGSPVSLLLVSQCLQHDARVFPSQVILRDTNAYLAPRAPFSEAPVIAEGQAGRAGRCSASPGLPSSQLGEGPLCTACTFHIASFPSGQLADTTWFCDFPAGATAAEQSGSDRPSTLSAPDPRKGAACTHQVRF